MHRPLDEYATPAVGPTNSLRPATDSRPHSATAVSTGFAGLLAAVLAFAAFAQTGLPIHMKALGIVGATAAAMLALELFVHQTRKAQTAAGLADSALRPLDLARTMRKLTGLAVTIGVVAAVYWVLAEYRRDLYAPFFAAVAFSAPAFLILTPLYVAFVDRRQRDPEDAYADIGAFLIAGRMPHDLVRIRQHALGWAVKAFFLPLMFVYLCSSIENVGKVLHEGDLTGLLAWHGFLVDGLFGIDVLFACVGYSLTLRLFGTQIRGVEPTVIGWVVCLVCYQPFNGMTNAYITYDAGGWKWDAVFAGWPPLQIAWAGAILLCVLIYAWSTVAFGPRFSNLTNRGIITVGPYRWVKHPAYLSKNISWWLISMPFLLGGGLENAVRYSAMLLLFNGVYVLRAITEERHLSCDPDYVAYKAYIAGNGLWARLRRVFAPPDVRSPAPPPRSWS